MRCFAVAVAGAVVVVEVLVPRPRRLGRALEATTLVTRVRRAAVREMVITRPTLVVDAMDPGDCERWCDALLEAAGEVVVVAQSQLRGGGSDQYERRFRDFILEDAFDSDHDDAALVFDEGLLGDVDHLLDDVDLAAIVRDAREGCFPDSDEDWFALFPDDARPRDCFVCAGEGARSTLHRDPFDWTGTNLVLEGSKVWRFLELPPAASSSSVDDLDAYPLNSVAWGGGNDDAPLSRGWQSDHSLYESRAAAVPSALALAHLPDEDRRAALDACAASATMLAPSIAGVPFTAVVQHPGELLLIPRGWWHQTYALEPSVAVASQRCGRHDAQAVIDHILDTTKAPPRHFDLAAPRAAVRDLFDHLQSTKRRT